MKFGLKETTIETIVNVIKKYSKVEKACIFGSRARGDYKHNSDIDIALFGEQLNSSINTKIFYEIDDLLLPYRIDLINFNELTVEDNIRKDILNEGVDIYARK